MMMSADETVRRRKRARTFDVPAVHLKELWEAVAAERIEHIRDFFRTYPDMGAYWAQYPAQLAATLRKHACAGTDARKVEALAALFVDGGVPMLPEDEHAVLHHIVTTASMTEKIRKCVLGWIKEQPARAELLLVMAAEACNVYLFQHVLATYSSSSRSNTLSLRSSAIWFDTCTPTRRSVLHAIVRWPDAAIRRKFLTMLLPHCSAAYVTQVTYALEPLPAAASSSPANTADELSMLVPGAAVPALPDGPWPVPTACSAIEEAAACADSVSLEALLCRAREDALLDDMILTRALYVSLRASTAYAASSAACMDSLSRSDTVTHAHALCATMLMGCMSVRALLQFHVHLDALRNKAVAVKAHITLPSASGAARQTTTTLASTTAVECVLSSLTKAHALYAAIVKRATDEEERTAFMLGTRTLEIDNAFDARTRQYMATIDRALTLRDELQQLRLEKRVLIDMLERKSSALRVLTSRLLSGDPETVVKPSMTADDTEFAKWIADMDAAHAEMLTLLLPDVPTSALPAPMSLSTNVVDAEIGPGSPMSNSVRAQGASSLPPFSSSFGRSGSSHSLASLHSSDTSIEERFSKIQASAISLTALEARLARLQAPVHARPAIALALLK